MLFFFSFVQLATACFFVGRREGRGRESAAFRPRLVAVSTPATTRGFFPECMLTCRLKSAAVRALTETPFPPF